MISFFYAGNACCQANRVIDKQPSEVRVQIVRGPYLQAATPTSMVIRWRTDLPSPSVVRYGIKPDGLYAMVTSPKAVYEHIVKLDYLQPLTSYYYSVGTGTQVLVSGGPYHFTTLPPAGTEAKFRIGIFGDCGNNSTNQRQVRDAFVNYLGKDTMTAWLLLGDNAYNDGTDAEYGENFFAQYQQQFLSKYPLFPAPGNHDYRGGDRARTTHYVAYHRVFSMPSEGEAGGVPSYKRGYYAFDIGNIHFISLDSYGRYSGATMYDTNSVQARWVKRDLEAYRKSGRRGWVVAFWHHPPFTMGSHNSDTEEELARIRKDFIVILERYGVDLVLTGHSHVYERTKLIGGHYGRESSFRGRRHNLSGSDGTYSSKNSCPYVKDDRNCGTVYVVSGSAGAVGGAQKSWPHAAMHYANNEIGGACMLEVEGSRLDLKWIAADGKVKDHFVMMKNVNRRSVISIQKGQKAILTASFVGEYNWSHDTSHARRVEVSPERNTTYKVKDRYDCIEDVFEVQVK